ncbi:unnamed protein product [Phytophthora fragariaefolia]|uniref:Unnamed protein product n=1 Tax=Phytophthora fragariaefolia TaxID=1490495 RepID=A0A9W6U5H6_9STRA|nr:unnamed protein product [Phytophthora fragariaefolia]
MGIARHTVRNITFAAFSTVQLRMALLDDDDAFEAALSFLDEYTLDEGGTEALGALCGDEPLASEAPRVNTQGPARQRSQDDMLRRKMEYNERRKVLRRTGVYGDPNRSRNQRKKEIALLREQLQKLQQDLEALQSRAAERSGQE